MGLEIRQFGFPVGGHITNIVYFKVYDGGNMKAYENILKYMEVIEINSECTMVRPVSF